MKEPSSLSTPRGKYIVLYDGLCPFCTRQSQNLTKLARRGMVEAVNFHEPGALARFPGITHDACMKAIHLVSPDGQVYKGFEAIVRALATRPLLSWLLPVCQLPGLRTVLDRLYRFMAANRYRFWGKSADSRTCEAGTCRLHGFSK
jgi:predicted DCC family thiol-disulfide oxidoreductase YuxK